MNEFDFIRQIKTQFPNNWEKSVGNDCAVFHITQKNGLITKDLLVEGVHFFPDIPLDSLAYKSLLVNLSDIFADGGIPLFFEIGIGASKKDYNRIGQLYSFYSSYCNKWAIPILGGDTVASPVFFISVTCVGQTNNDPWLRKNAKIGDWIYLTGNIGSAAYGLEKIKEKGHFLSDSDICRHLFPPFLKGAVLYLQGQVNAAIDISDGFLQDLARILEESEKGAELYYDKIPFAKTLPEEKKERYGFYGGEDYELLFTSSKEIHEKDFYEKTGFSLSKVGRITNSKNNIILKSSKQENRQINIKEIKGFDHWH